MNLHILIIIFFISMFILFLSASIMMLHDSKIFNTKVYVLKDKNDILIAAFGSKSEVLSFFWALCDTTKEDFKLPMFKSDSFRVAKLYLTSLGYKLIKVKPEELDFGEQHNR